MWPAHEAPNALLSTIASERDLIAPLAASRELDGQWVLRRAQPRDAEFADWCSLLTRRDALWILRRLGSAGDSGCG